MDVFNQLKDRAEDAADEACKQMMMEQAEDEIKGIFKKPGEDEEDKDDGGDNKALRMAGKFASSFLGEDKDEGSVVEKIASDFFGEDKKEDSGLDVKNFFGGLPKLI